MTLPTTRTDREMQKFMADLDGNVAVRIAPGAVTDSDGNELDIDEHGSASMHDRVTNDNLKAILWTLDRMLDQLKLITGA